MLWGLTSILPTILNPTLPVHLTRSYTQFLRSMQFKYIGAKAASKMLGKSTSAVGQKNYLYLVK